MQLLLLDTHTIIWFLNGDTALSEVAKQIILNPRNTKYVSMASIWEVAIKISIGKLHFDGGTAEFIRLIESNGFHILPIAKNHILELEHLPYIHRDPFDRILIATALADKMILLTVDGNIQKYEVPYIW